MPKSNEDGDDSDEPSKETTKEVPTGNIVRTDEIAGCSAAKDSHKHEDARKPDDTSLNVVSKASSSSSHNIDATNKHDTEDKQLVLLRKACEKLHCPFYWQVDIPINAYGNHEIDLLTDFEDMFEGISFQFRRFVVHLIMCYHTFHKNAVSKSREILEKMERMLVRSARKESRDYLFNTIRDALYHVSHSCHVFIHNATNEIEKAYTTMEKIMSYDSMDESNKAAIWGIRAAVYAEYGYEGVKAALEFTEKAVELDVKNAYWLFYRGVYLGRLRRMEKGPTQMVPTEEEIWYLEKARSLHEDPAFYAFLAETYLECVKSIRIYNYPPRSRDIFAPSLEKLSMKAAQYFEKCVILKENCAHLLFRCGKGFMRLPPPHQNLEKAKNLLQRGLELAPKSSYGNHAMAMFKMEYENDIETAQRYLETSKNCKNFPAHMDFCRIHYLEGRNPDFLIPELRTMLEIYNENPKRCKIYGELICCYLFVDYNLIEACKCARRLLEMQTEWIEYIYEFKSGLFPFSQPVAIVNLLVAETALRRQCKDTTEAEKSEYTNFFKLLQKNVDLHDTSKTILQKYSDDLKRELQKKRQRLAAKSCDRRIVTSQSKIEQRDAPNNEYRDRKNDTSSSHERRGSHERQRRDEQRVTKAMASLTFDVNKRQEKSISSLPTNEMSTTEKIEAFILNTRHKGGDIQYSAESSAGTSKTTKNSVRNDENGSVDRESMRSGRGQKKERTSSVERSRNGKSRRHSLISVDRQSRSSRKKKNYRSPSVDSKSRKSIRTCKRDRSSSLDKQSKSSRRKKDHRSPSVGRESVTSYRRVKKNRCHSSSSSGSLSRLRRRKKSSRSPSEDQYSTISNRSHGRDGYRSSSSSERQSRSSRRQKSRRIPSVDRKSVTSNPSCKKSRHPSSSDSDRQSQSGRKKNNHSQSVADTKSVCSNRSSRPDPSNSSLFRKKHSKQSNRKVSTDRSPCSVASSRRNRREEHDRTRSRSSSVSMPDHSNRSERSGARYDNIDKRSRRQRSVESDYRSGSRERRDNRRRHQRSSSPNERGRRSDERYSLKKHSRRRHSRDGRSESSGSSSSSCVSKRGVVADLRE